MTGPVSHEVLPVNAPPQGRGITWLRCGPAGRSAGSGAGRRRRAKSELVSALLSAGGVPPRAARFSGRGGLPWRPCPAGFLRRAHQADVVAVRISHDRVPRAPEGVERRLPRPVARLSELGVAIVDGLPGRPCPVPG